MVTVGFDPLWYKAFVGRFRFWQDNSPRGGSARLPITVSYVKQKFHPVAMAGGHNFQQQVSSWQPESGFGSVQTLSFRMG